MLGFALNLDKVTALEYACYSCAEHAANTIEAEETAKAIKESKDTQGNSPEKIGANVTVPNSSVHSPFGEWEK